MNQKIYVIVALYNFDGGFPVFNELIGVASDTQEAFQKMERYDYQKVIRSDYEMEIDEVGTAREFGMRNGKLFYEERRKYQYRIHGEEAKGIVHVTFSIFES